MDGCVSIRLRGNEKDAFMTDAAPQTFTEPQTHQQNQLHELMTPETNVQRIMWTGTIWFVGVIGSVAIVAGLLLSSGWRPSLLSAGTAVLWWGGWGLVDLSIGRVRW